MKKHVLMASILALLTGGANAAGDAAQYFNNVTLAKGYKSQTDHNPLFTQRFGADPCAMVYGDEVYIYMTNDVLEYKNGALIENTYGQINTINCVSSKDMVNWTDHGTMSVAKTGPAKWASCSWAPTACHAKINGKEKFFLYFANNGSGIGVVTSDCPWGPWTDPIGAELVSRRTPNCGNVTWLFDPAVLVDDDGTGYIYFGGGVPSGREADPGTARVAKLGKDFISIDGEAKTINPPYLFEDAGINKIGNQYVYSYCTNWNTGGNRYGFSNAEIGYMTSSNPMGTFTFKGVAYANQGAFLSGQNGGNNHHSMFKFKDKWYMTYHARLLQNAMNICPGKNLNYRSTHVDYVNVNEATGTITKSKGSVAGVAQVQALNPFEKTEAETMAWMGGIDTRYGGSNMLVTKIDKGDWIGVAGVDFGAGASVFTACVSSTKESAIKICKGSANGTVIGYLLVPNTGGQLKEVSAKLDVNITGKTDLFFVLGGDFEFDYWMFKTADVSLEASETDVETGTTITLTASANEKNVTKADFYLGNKLIGSATTAPFTLEYTIEEAGKYEFKAVLQGSEMYETGVVTVSARLAQGPYEGVAQTLPGIVEVERYDVGGEGYAYHDATEENEGKQFRTDEGVDLDVAEDDGYVLGWTQKGEWVEYTVEVLQEDSYEYTATVASGLDGAAFRLYMDDKAITDVISVPNTGEFTSYTTIKGSTSKLTQGKHILKLTIEGSYANIDKISFRAESTPIEYTFTSPSDEETKLYAGEEFNVAWTTNDIVKGTFNLNWVDKDGTVTLLKKGVTIPGAYETMIPEEYEGREGHYELTKVGGGLIPSDLDGKSHTVNNPLIWADVPDVSVIRVDDTYYMASTTMHMNPGVPIMASKDLVRWRTINYAHQALDNSDALNLNAGKNAYGKGSWASCIRYRKGTWYVLTPSYTTNSSHIFKTNDIMSGKWETARLPFYHDPSLILDDDDRIYVAYGSGNISIVELSSDAMSVKSGSTSRTLIQKPASIAGSNFYVECEGTQVVKHDGYYYVFLISWPAGSCRSVLCYRSKSLTGSFEGKILLQDNGVAQGGIFDTPDGNWYGMFFRDNGSVGRIPYLVPMTWANGWPVLGNNGKVPGTLNMPAAQEDGYGMVTSDDFEESELPLEWQWNHNPDNKNWSLTGNSFRITTSRTDKAVVDAKNTLTQRTFGPNCSGWTKLNTKGMKDGDYAGLVALQELYGFAGVKVNGTSKSIIMVDASSGTAKEAASIPLNGDEVYLRIDMNYQNQTDKATFYYSLDGKTWTSFGNTIKMEYKLTHFMGYRYGLFNFATKNVGGYADFDFFRIGKDVNSAIYLDKTGEETTIASSAEVSILKRSTTNNLEESTSVANCTVAPNPASEYVKVSGVKEIIRLELYTLDGKFVNASATDEIDLPGAGNYLLRIQTGNGTITKQVLAK